MFLPRPMRNLGPVLWIQAASMRHSEQRPQSRSAPPSPQHSRRDTAPQLTHRDETNLNSSAPAHPLGSWWDKTGAGQHHSPQDSTRHKRLQDDRPVATDIRNRSLSIFGEHRSVIPGGFSPLRDIDSHSYSQGHSENTHADERPTTRLTTAQERIARSDTGAAELLQSSIATSLDAYLMPLPEAGTANSVLPQDLNPIPKGQELVFNPDAVSGRVESVPARSLYRMQEARLPLKRTCEQFTSTSLDFISVSLRSLISTFVLLLPYFFPYHGEAFMQLYRQRHDDVSTTIPISQLSETFLRLVQALHRQTVDTIRVCISFVPPESACSATQTHSDWNIDDFVTTVIIGVRTMFTASETPIVSQSPGIRSSQTQGQTVPAASSTNSAREASFRVDTEDSLARTEASGGRGGDEEGMCSVCLSRPRNTVLLPCAHFVLCSVCVARLWRCPLCRGEVLATIPVLI